jgi:hypothetical protein
MFATYTAGTLRRTLTPDDLAGVNAIYGSGAASAVTSLRDLPPLSLQPGANLITWPGADSSPDTAFAAATTTISAIYTFDAPTGKWLRYLPGAGQYVNSLRSLQPGAAYWVIATGAALIPMPAMQ